MLGMPEGVLPEPGLPWTLAGELTAPAAAALGLPAGTPVALGAHDGVAANIGAGAFSEREYVITLGTHAVVRTVAAALPAGARRFYGFPPGSHVIGGNAWFAGRTADWLLELLGLAGSDDRTPAYRELERMAGTVPAGARGVRFLPHLEGQRAPQYHPGARGAFAGLALAHGQAELGRAVLEGAACAVRAVFEEVAGWCGPPRRLRVTGGGAENRLWVEILVNLLGAPIEWTGPAAEARGAAICLAVALGIHEDPAQAAAAMVAVDRRIEPEPALAAAYEEIYRDWDRLGRLSRVLI
jgi:sugar (pentulose or hexulose) kinase